ncbi:SRPBCC family protein [Umezawaea endophytica]|uniref:SRPBCC family protein n=1 Tax=Umezawaea endophytica TaxID=1654476 RepID=A0A9X2VQJ5_9PSEU|nr:SRPBCC family protein [Umezawaea endophytica]MCS7479633.1 SRPBCC family protein [Umezawaea endophytica]
MTTELDTLDVTGFAFTRRTWVAAPPAAVYDLVSDVSTIERWSPSASAVAYDAGDGPRVGAWFSGHNRRGEQEWTTRSQVVAAAPGAEFAFVVGGVDEGIVRWRWTFHEDGDGTVVAQSWRLLRHVPALGTTLAEVAELRDHMTASVESTLIALARWISTPRN